MEKHKIMDCIWGKMVVMKEIGIIMNLMGMEYKLGKMEVFIKDNICKAKNMDQEFTNGQINHSM